MNRTFQHRLSAVSLLMPTLLILLTVRVLWTPRISHFLVALFLVIVIVMMMERLLHTTYVFEHHQLKIMRGRFSRPITIHVGDITNAKVVTHRFLPVRYILIEYGRGKTIGVQPVNEQGFLNEIKKRQNEEI